MYHGRGADGTGWGNRCSSNDEVELKEIYVVAEDGQVKAGDAAALLLWY